MGPMCGSVATAGGQMKARRQRFSAPIEAGCQHLHECILQEGIILEIKENESL